MPSPVILKVNYGADASLPSTKTDGSLYFTTTNKYIYAKFPSIDAFAINAPYAASAGSANATIASLTAGTKSFNGSTGVSIDYNDVGAAPATNISLASIDWTSTPGTTGGKIPASLLPKEALLDLVVVEGTDPTAATGVEVGDLVQTNDNKLYYVTAVSGGKPTTTTEIHVGGSAYATTAGSVTNSLVISKAGTDVTSFNGGAAARADFKVGTVVNSANTSTSNGTLTAATGKTAYINNLFAIGTTTNTTAAVGGSFALKVAGSLTLGYSSGTITIGYTAPTALPNANALTLQDGTSGGQSVAYTGAAAATWKFAAGTGISLSSATSEAVTTMTINATAYTGTSPITVSNFGISHANSGVTAGSYGLASNSTLTINSSNGVSVNVPYISVNATGHVTSASTSAATIKVSVSQVLTEGTKCATIAGTDIYAGTAWGTF